MLTVRVVAGPKYMAALLLWVTGQAMVGSASGVLARQARKLPLAVTLQLSFEDTSLALVCWRRSLTVVGSQTFSQELGLNRLQSHGSQWGTCEIWKRRVTALY